LALETDLFGSAQSGGKRARIEALDTGCFRSVQSGCVHARLENFKSYTGQCSY
jgi:hypothetical protein